MKPAITIALQCHNFQKRLCWMLSSIAQQTRADLIELDIACIAGNGRPSTEEVVKCFSNWSDFGLRISTWDSLDRFQYRGLIRNRQMQESTTEWMMFADADMVYHPEYFERLYESLERDHANAPYMISSGRTSNPKELTNKLVDDTVGTDPAYIVDAFAKADKLPKIRRGNVGAGFCQIINMDHAPHDGYYVKPKENADWSWTRGSNPRSDRQFRHRIAAKSGKRRGLPIWFSDNAIHLNHDRDPDAGRHLETQR